MKNRLLLVLMIILFPFALSAKACDDTCVRDAAFQIDRDIYRLCVIAEGDDPAAKESTHRLKAWLTEEATGLNLALERLHADDASLSWKDYGMPAAPPRVPVVALIGRFPALQRIFVVDHWEPGLQETDLSVLKSSPARKAIKEKIVRHWAVILYSPGTDASGGSARRAIDNVCRKWNTEHPPGVDAVQFDRTDPKERLLQAFTGVQPSGPDWAGVMFGRGLLMAPPLQGREITEDNLGNVLDRLKAPCTCLQRANAPGLAVPMTWDKKLDTQVVALGASFPDAAAAFMATRNVMEPELADEERHLLLTAVALLITLMIITGGSVAFMVLRKRGRDTISIEEY